MLEVDLELVAFLGDDLSVAELAVEDALAEGEVGAALVAEGDGRGSGFDRGACVGVATPHPPTAKAAGPSLSLKGRGASGGSLPSGTA